MYDLLSSSSNYYGIIIGYEFRVGTVATLINDVSSIISQAAN